MQYDPKSTRATMNCLQWDRIKGQKEHKADQVSRSHICLSINDFGHNNMALWSNITDVSIFVDIYRLN